MPETTPAISDSARELDRLLAIMARLRDPKSGCPWDLEQDFRSIVQHTIEEAYEVADAIEKDDMAALVGELGDFMFQVVFYAQMAREAGHFSMVDVLKSINIKMIERHPHVFSSVEINTASAQTLAWENHKAAERAKQAAAEGRPPSALDGVIGGLPALTRADKLQKRAARIGFDWRHAGEVVAKIEEELAEVRAELGSGDRGKLDEELGDLLFAVTNLARHLEIDAEGALRRANAKFERRFRQVEERLRAENLDPANAGLDRMEEAWNAVKRAEARES
ncbi:ATP diphosphatase [Dongia mobilis]|uniref:Nucleoside triphosphate pyrophosphohydrolase n=1 Tax=Dongia mobilis TaxID=578943 RepID=A0A4R6WW66_9PROT|nr:nucleoside triphosphate pyrophosphohydrolase [Dongia mobilis]TDQ81518.1 ATP diphosphatase [Dongia mobilis]